MIGAFDSSVLLGLYQARNATIGAGATAAKPKVPTPPWSAAAKPPEPADLVRSALLGRRFVDPVAAKVDVKSASGDYQKLFALYSGLNTLREIAKRYDVQGVTESEQNRLSAAFTRGMAEVSAYLDTARFEDIRVTQGKAAEKAKSAVGVARPDTSFTTKALQSGSWNTPVAAFDGDVRFSLSIDRLGAATTIDIDLAEISGPRTVASVVNLVNGKLEAAGLSTRFGISRTAGETKQIQVGGQTLTLPAGPDSFGFKIIGDSTETLSFSAPEVEPAIYLGQTVGDPDPDGKSATDDGETFSQLLKLQTGVVGGGSPTVFTNSLAKEIGAIRSTLTGADGSVYVLADVTGTVDGQAIKGGRDVALQKYDASGALVFTRTLGAADEARGLALAVSDDGKIAVAGSVRGGLIEGGRGADPGKTDSFVTLYDSAGEELWTRREGVSGEDEATAIAFAADGALHVAGRTRSALPGNLQTGGWDGYLRSYSVDGDATGAAQYGTTGDDRPAGLVIDGRAAVLASVEGGRAVLRRFTLGGDPVQTATRDLGGLAGGDIAGLSLQGGRLVIGGAAGGDLAAGTVTRAAAGGLDAFAASLAADLSADPADSIAYYGGAGDERASALTVSGGKVWLAGSARQDLPGAPAIGKQDGFVVGLDVAAGDVAYSRRLAGGEGYVAPTSIAVDAAGASVLDRLGLPRGEVAYSDSPNLVAATAVRAGDQFQIRARAGARPASITIGADDTLETLAAKIRRAAGFSVKVDIVSDSASRRLQIQPTSERYTAELISGPAGRDALDALGLSPGLLRAMKVKNGVATTADGGPAVYGLSLDRDLTIATKSGLKAAVDQLSNALTQVRGAYREVSGQNGVAPTGPGKRGGTVPAYLTNQIANYQSALARLTGGG